MDNYAKMRRSNTKAKVWLVQNGYQNITFFPHTQWQKDLHFEGLDFDGLCSKGIELCLFQTKSNCKISKKMLEDYRNVSKKYSIRCMWINVVDKKGVEVYE